MLFNHALLCFPLFLLPSILSSIKVSSSELSLLIRWPKYPKCGAGEDSRESLALQGDPTSQSYRKSGLNSHGRTEAEAPIFWPPDAKKQRIQRDFLKKKSWPSQLLLRERSVQIHLSHLILESESASCSVVSDSLRPHGLQPARLLSPWTSPDKNTGVGCHVLLQGIFPTQGSNLALLYGRQILHCLSHQGGP